MTRVFNNLCTVYRFDNFLVDVFGLVWEPCEYRAWLYHIDYGIKMFMFGIPVGNVTFDEFVNIVEKNLDDCIKIYKTRFMDEKR